MQRRWSRTRVQSLLMSEATGDVLETTALTAYREVGSDQILLNSVIIQTLETPVNPRIELQRAA